MGWTFSHQWSDKRSMIAHLTSPQTYMKTIAKCVRGNVLWTVHEYTAESGPCRVGYRFIGCYLLGGNKDEGWGYKDLDEGCGPVDISCPISYFALVPDPPNQWARDWREKVKARAEHDRKIRTCKVGDTLVLRDGCKPEKLTVTSVKPLRAVAGYCTYRVSARHVADVIPAV